MRRLIIISAAAVAAAGLAAAPAVAGLSENPTFSHQLNIRVPSQARVADVVDDSSSPSASRTTEPGDDRGATTEPGDDSGATTGPGDDGSNRGPSGPTSTPTPSSADDSGTGGGDNSGPGGSDTTSTPGSDDGGHRSSDG
ncbi:MAG: hypothetical protein QOG80_2971 [Pseudonocardiales bacterium]|nr:hypothetical protein [Pseudonocardiales bacterium]